MGKNRNGRVKMAARVTSFEENLCNSPSILSKTSNISHLRCLTPLFSSALSKQSREPTVDIIMLSAINGVAIYEFFL